MRRLLPAARERRLIALVLAGWALWLGPRPAAAQVGTIRYAEEPTAGLDVPATPLAGEHDAYSVVKNPAGLSFLDGFAAGLGLDLGDEDDSTSLGQGFGLYFAQALSGGFLPRLGLGLGLEFLHPSRQLFDPDPGAPTRLTLSTSLPVGRLGALGLAWHRMFDDPGRPTRGLSSFDLGLSARFGSHLAFGAVVRDLDAPVAGNVQIQRRYELELVGRPVATDRLELGLGGRIGEIRGDVDAWLRGSVRVARGVYLKGEFGTRELTAIETTATGTLQRDEREYVASAGVEISFGGVGGTLLASGHRSASGERRLTSGVLYVRASSKGIPSLLGPTRRIERLELSGDLDDRQLTAAILYLRSLSRDPAVVGVILQIDGIGAGFAEVEELRAEILRVRQAGKKVFAYLVAPDTRDYFLATSADKIYLDPAGGIRLTGFAANMTYLKGTFDKVGVTAQFEKIEEYKSAPEQWTRDSPTEPALRMRNELFDSFYDDLVAAIASGRNLGPDKVRELIDHGPYTAGDLGTVARADGEDTKSSDAAGGTGATSPASAAKQASPASAGNPASPASAGNPASAASTTGATSPASGATSPASGALADKAQSSAARKGYALRTADGRPRDFGDDLTVTSPLVDAIVGPEALGRLITEELGGAYPVTRAPRLRDERWSLPEIAIIYISGDIVAGKSRSIPLLGRRMVGGDTIVQAIARARANPRIKAIVLRIDSPGGSALASELMAREVFRTRGIKPILCSMGNYAASGGYFVAAGCDTILADSMTITGSIGIFYGKFDISHLLSRLGVTWYTQKRGASADQESPLRPYTDEERAFVKERIRYFYNRFVDAVAKGRNMTREEVDAIGRGRVWSGSQAKEHKLVDELGGLSDALTLAKARIGLGDDDKVRLVLLPEVPQSLLGRILGLPGLGQSRGDGQGDSGILGLPGISELFDEIPTSLLAEPDAVQARLPFNIVWR